SLFLILLTHSISILYPYTTLFRSLLTTLQNATNILNLDTDNVTKLTTSNRDRLTLISYGAFADYDYKEKYLASASIRRDGSSNLDRKSTRLNSSHVKISYAVFCMN